MKSIKITDSIVKKRFSGSVLFTLMLVFLLTVLITSCSNDQKDKTVLSETSGQINGKVMPFTEKGSKTNGMIAGSNCGECHSGIDSKAFQTEHSNPKKDDAAKVPGTLLHKKGKQ